MFRICDSFSKSWLLCDSMFTCNNRQFRNIHLCVITGDPSKSWHVDTCAPLVDGPCFVSRLNSLTFLLRAVFEIPRPFAPRSPQFNFFAPSSRHTTTNRSSSFSHMSGTSRTRSARIASNARVKEEGGTEDGMTVPQETVEKLQSYAFRPTGKRKGYKSEGTSEGRWDCSSTSGRRFFHFRSVSIIRNGRAFRAIRQIKNYC